MNVSTDPCLILLAAGRSRRFGTPKQLACVDGEPLLRRAARHAVQTGSPVIVVLGAHACAVRRVLGGLLLDVIVNTHWSEGMGRSIACGVRRGMALHPQTSGALLCLADQPLVDTRALTSLLAAHSESPKRIICADYGTVRGPPCLFPRALLSSLTRLEGAQGARSLLRQHAANVTPLAMPDAAWDIDTREDFARMQRHGET